MAEEINDLLNFSRLTRRGIKFERVNISEIASEILNQLRENEPNRVVKFNIEDNIVVNGDRKLLRIVLENLFKNAWKFTSKREFAEIAFGKIDNGEISEYFVRDNGAGFDMTYADKLFGVFQRLHSLEEFEGTGMGLVAVQRIIHHHGGLTRAEGKVGEGATFYFTFDL